MMYLWWFSALRFFSFCFFLFVGYTLLRLFQCLLPFLFSATTNTA